MLGLRLDAGTEARLARVAQREGRTKSDGVRDAIRAHLTRIDGDAELVEEVKRVAALTSEEDLAYLDELQDDLEDLLAEEEAALSVRRAARIEGASSSAPIAVSLRPSLDLTSSFSGRTRSNTITR